MVTKDEDVGICSGEVVVGLNARDARLLMPLTKQPSRLRSVPISSRSHYQLNTPRSHGIKILFHAERSLRRPSNATHTIHIYSLLLPMPQTSA